MTDFNVRNGTGHTLVDFSDRIFVPIPQYSLITYPSTIELRQGDVKKIQVQLRSNYQPIETYNYTLVSLPQAFEDISDFRLDERHSKLPNKDPVPLYLYVDYTADSGLYDLGILVKHSSKPKFYNVTNAQGDEFIFNQGISYLETSLPITILDPLNLQQQFKSFVEDYIEPIDTTFSFAVGILTGIGSLFIYRKRGKIGDWFTK